MENRSGSVIAAVIAAVAIAVSAACTPGKTSPGPKPTAPSLTAPSLSGQALSEQQALQAYRGMWHAYAMAGQSTSSQNSDLDRYTDADALAALKAGLATNRSQGLISQGEPVTNPVVVQLDPPGAPTSVEIRDCLDTTNFLRTKADGSSFTDTPGGRRQVTATVKKLADQWKVTKFIPGEVGSCA